MTIITTAFLALGSFFCLTAAIAMLRFPDAYARLHAGTKCLTAGASLIFIAIALNQLDWAYASKASLLIVFFFISNPVASHSIARACYRRRIGERNVILDEYEGFLEKEGEL